MFSEIKAHRQAGFSLIELLVVVLIIGILATIAIPSLLKQRDKAKNAGAQATVRSALTAAKSYYTENDSYNGLTATTLNAEEKTLGTAEPADTQAPGDTADPKNIWIGNGTDGTNPVTGDTNGGQVAVLCAVSKGDTIFCIDDNQRAGTTEFKKFKVTGTGFALNNVDGAAAGDTVPTAALINSDKF